MNSLLRNKNIWLKGVAIASAAIAPGVAFAAGPPKPSALDNPLAVILLVVIVGLLLVIGLLAHVVLGAAQMYMQRWKEANRNNQSVPLKAVSVIALTLISCSVFAADAPAETKEVVVNTISGLSKVAFYSLMTVIGVELIIIFGLLYFLQRLLAKEKQLSVIAGIEPLVVKDNKLKIWWMKINSFKSMKEESDIELDHNYDGIKELDNRLPPWWLYSFYICIIFAGIYLWRYHVSKTAPLSTEEYAIQMQKAEEEKEAYLAKAGNLVDENTVKMLEADGVAAGQVIFSQKCAPCHASDGGGTVGPNLVDDYWLHGGSINSVFKTIKYGVPEKGMLAWKDQLSPKEIAQVASFIKSIKGAKVAAAKEPQGELYKDDASPNAADSTKKIAALH